MTARTDSWYLAQLKPGGFVRARTNLERQGFATFMPLRKTTVRKSGRLRPASRPIFPGYLFVEILAERPEWRKINATFGVARLVTLDRQTPARVPKDLMAELVARCDGETWQTEPCMVHPGKSVRVVQGPFANMLATIESLPEGNRVFVLLDLMGRSTRVGVGLGDLELI